METATKIPQIDIENIISSKNPQLLRWLPKFIIRYIKKIIHQEEVNAFLRNNHEKMGLEFVRAVIAEFQISVTSKGLEHLPSKGGVILASNHPLGGLDALALMGEVEKVRSDQQFLVNDILMALKNLSPVFVPINKHGRNRTDSLQKISDTYASENCTLIFPAGLVSRKQDGSIKDLAWQKSFISQAVKNNRQIIPVYIEAKNSKFFYNLAYWRKKLGIKANIEMFFLVDEMYKQKKQAVTIYFGEPISPSTFTKEHSDSFRAEEVKKIVYSLKA